MAEIREFLINDAGEGLTIVNVTHEKLEHVPWTLKTCLYRDAIDTVYMSLDYLDHIDEVKNLGPAELIERLDAADAIRVIPFEGTMFVPCDWIRETFPCESTETLCRAIEEVSREAWAQFNQRN